MKKKKGIKDGNGIYLKSVLQTQVRKILILEKKEAGQMIRAKAAETSWPGEARQRTCINMFKRGAVSLTVTIAEKCFISSSSRAEGDKTTRPECACSLQAEETLTGLSLSPN